MDKLNLNFYALSAIEVAPRYEVASSLLDETFVGSLSSSGCILGKGFGSGLDLVLFQTKSIRPYVICSAEYFVQLAQMFHPELKGM
jgi:hypothetical protein